MTATTPTPEDRRQICAAMVLASAEDGPQTLGVFTDEELTALDGLSLDQLVPMPRIAEAEETIDTSAAASVALRSLIARRMVLPAELLADTWEDLGEDPRRLYAIDPLQGILTLRRSFAALLTYQRMVSEQVHTVVQYVSGQSTVLEEEITADGYHHVFALTVASLITRDGDAEQLTSYAASDRLVVSRSDQDPTGSEVQEDPLLEFAEASADSVREIARGLLLATDSAS